MTTEWPAGFLFRVLLPASLLTAGTGHFLRGVWYTSSFFLLLQGALQIAFGVAPPHGAVWEEALESIGIIRLSRADAGNALRLLAPDVGMALVGLVVFRMSKKLAKPSGTPTYASPDTEAFQEQQADGEGEGVEDCGWDSEDDPPSSWSEDSIEGSMEEAGGMIQDGLLRISSVAAGLRKIMEPLVSSAGKVLVTLLLGLAGMVSPSVTSAVYFGAFLGLGSWWACQWALSALAFSSLCVFMTIFTAGHLGSLYLYQFPVFQDLVPPEDIHARLLGMTGVIRTNRTEPWKLHVHAGLRWPEVVNPFILLLTYYALVLLLKLQAPPPANREETALPSHSEDLELSSVQCTSGSEGDQLTLPQGSWQDLPLLHCTERQEQDAGLDSPAFFVLETREETLSGCTETATQTRDTSTGPSSITVLCHLALRHSYVTALITMMVASTFLLRRITLRRTRVWSITHNSWLSFVLLLWACVIWMARDRRSLALLSAPGLVLYANLLVLLNFYAGLRLSQEELFPGVPDWLLADLDLKPYPQPCLHLGIKSLYASLFWLLLRQRVLERQVLAEVVAEAPSGEAGSTPASSLLVDMLGSFLRGLLAKYWIYVCGSMFFVISFDGKVVVYKIVYIFLFLAWVALYQMNYAAWRRLLKSFWVVVVSYSMVVLCVLYTYQFQTTAAFFTGTLGLSEEGLRDVGLEQFSTAELFAKILRPAAFLLACILQLHYFNEEFLKTTSHPAVPIPRKGPCDSNMAAGRAMQLLADALKDTIWKLRKSLGANKEKEAMWTGDDKASCGVTEAGTSDWDSAIDKLAAGFLKLLETINGAQALLWCLLEMHILKLVSSVAVWLTLQEVSLMNSLFYVSWVTSLPYAKLRPGASRLSTLWACGMVICKMMYQLKCVEPSAYASNCTEVWQENKTRLQGELQGATPIHLRPVDPAEWLGALRKCHDRVLPCLQHVSVFLERAILVQGQLIILALMTLEQTVRRHQKFHRLRKQLPEPLLAVLADDITRAHLDRGLPGACLYFVNYGFYKFGLELSFVAALHVIGQRMDFYSLIHVIWLIYLLSLRRRKAIAEVWPRYCGFLVSLVILQYFLCLGLPPTFCKDYPWRTRSAVQSNLIQWLYLPDFARKPDANLLLYDFLLLLVASLQWQVFVDENKAVVRIQAGDNVEISRELRAEDLNQLSLLPNFIFCRSYLDLAKVAIFRYLFWFVICLVFLAGTTRINVLGAGYLVAFGYFMQRGNHLLLQPVKSILQPWDRLVACSVLAVAGKTLLSVGACVYLDTLLGSHCWLVHTLGMFCTGRGYQLTVPEDGPCEAPEQAAGILWDGVCFTFLLMQRRIFLSYYHLYVVADRKAAAASAPRAAELLRQVLRDALMCCEEEEGRSRRVAMERMEKIKAKQNKIAGLQRARGSPGALVDASERQLPGEEMHQEALKQGSQEGGYSLFETDSEDEEATEEAKQERKDGVPEPQTAFQLAYHAWTNSPKSALRMRRQDEEEAWESHPEGGEELAAREAKLQAEAGHTDEPDGVAQRLITLVQLLWVLGKVLLDDVTKALGTLSGGHVGVAAALRVDRHAWWRRVMARGDEELVQSDRFYRQLPRLVKLAFAFYQLVESRSEMMCYFVIVLNHTFSASMISMVLPILSFLWAMLSTPRPSKRFWMAAIYYTEATVLVKYMSQFGFFPWTTKRYAGINGEKPFSLPNLIGVEKKDHFALCDLLQLGILFFHRSTLKDLGLWDQPPSGQAPGTERASRTQRRTASPEQLSERMLKKQLKKGRKLVIKRTLQVYHPIRQFFHSLTHPEASPVCDAYALTFLVEVLNSVVVLFGYWAFGKYGTADLAESLAEDKVPEAFLVMALTQFGTMVVDRALYLRKSLYGKCVFQLVLVLGTHFWLFFILPGVTERRFNLNCVAQIWYLVKCVYFGLSAYQIKCGYPSHILGNFLTRNFNLLNFVLFKGFRSVPFLLELRAVIDWMWTDTALSLSNWICLEDLYADIFILKCWRESEKKYPEPPGQKKKKVVKYSVGGVIMLALISLMWFPLVFMSLLKTVGGVTNQPLDVSVKIAINGYETLFSMSSQQQNLVPFSDTAYDQLTQQYALHPPAMQFLVNYRPEDITLAKIKSHASLLWGISPANRAAMVKELANATSIYITVFWTVQRNVSLVRNVEASGKHTVCYADPETRGQLLRMLTHTRKEPVILPGLIPKALWTTAGTEAKMALRLDVAHSPRPQDIDRLAFFRNATVRLQQLRPAGSPETSPAAEWWVVQEWRPSCDQNWGCSRDLEVLVFNDKVSPQSLGFLAGYGIVGLYVSVVMVAAKFIREHFHGISRSIMFDELPSVDRVLALCTDIFLMREQGELELEQRLFHKLLFLYRSPETMIKWTRRQDAAEPAARAPASLGGAA
ncbi:piezo-type mechanosensitive ion channel component 2-like [Tenrec ecaudatus]|uniref:piezo-type mechanosensitive ion channel component 2-like n=1 Tax=Tenrec ecaudatus TaxID=94439 RepID=UPI003F5A4A64